MSMSRKEFLRTTGKTVLAAGAASAASPLLVQCAKKGKSSGGFNMEIKTKRLDLRHAWTIARNTSTYKEYAFVQLNGSICVMPGPLPAIPAPTKNTLSSS